MELKKRSAEVDGFGYPLSDKKCPVCKNGLHRVASGSKVYGHESYFFGGYKCFRCGYELVEQERGGVLGYGKTKAEDGQENKRLQSCHIELQG